MTNEKEKQEEVVREEETREEVVDETVETDEDVAEATSSEEMSDDEGTEEATEEEEERDPKDVRIEELERQLEEAEDKYLRQVASFDNYKRRMTLDKEEMQKYRSQSLMKELVPILDNFERALQTEVTSEDAIALKEGVAMIERGLKEALKNEGLEPIESVGEPFDPNFHQAVMTGQDDEQESGVVLEEFQKGYRLNDRIIRPSMVKVND